MVCNKQSERSSNLVVSHLLAFTMIEVMVAILIVGALVSMGLPRFRGFVAKARMAEAHQSLNTIAKLQKTYNLNYQMLGAGDNIWYQGDTSNYNIVMGMGGWHSECGATQLSNELGFRVEDCTKLRYLYKSFGAAGDQALNKGKNGIIIYPGCKNKDDIWYYRRTPAAGKSHLMHVKDVITQCK